MSEILTDIPRSFIEEFEDHIQGTLPEEKVQVELRQQQLARIMAATGSMQMEGLGQVAGRIDGRLYHRWLDKMGKAPPHEWVFDLLADNPMCRAKGYKPKADPTRHGHTFFRGESISSTKGKVQQ